MIHNPNDRFADKSVIEVGTIIPCVSEEAAREFAKKSKHWKLCDGSLLDSKDYPKLREVLGLDDVTLQIKLPNLAGKCPNNNWRCLHIVRVSNPTKKDSHQDKLRQSIIDNLKKYYKVDIEADFAKSYELANNEEGLVKIAHFWINFNNLTIETPVNPKCISIDEFLLFSKFVNAVKEDIKDD